mgnify:CR=1 FL=1
MLLSKLAEQLVPICKAQGLNYDPRVLPVKLTADCYIVYATPKTDECSSQGKCEVNRYYALTGGKTIQIIHE